MTGKSAEKSRLQIDVFPEQMTALEEMMRDCGLSTRKDLFNNAITLLEWAIQQVKQGNVIAALNPRDDHYVELQMPALTHAARWGRDDTRERIPMQPSVRARQ